VSWCAALGILYLLPVAGCQEDNEAGVIKPGEVGKADPKYSGDASYRQYHEDTSQKPADTKPKKRSR
jgi:hypothetical protein